MSLINVSYQTKRNLEKLPSILDRVIFLNKIEKDNREMLNTFEEGKYRDN